MNPLLVQWFCAEKIEAVDKDTEQKRSQPHCIPLAKDIVYDPLIITLGAQLSTQIFTRLIVQSSRLQQLC